VRTVLLAAISLVAAGTALSAGGTTSLRVVYRAEPGAPARVATLRCGPPAGTVVGHAGACRRIQALGRAAFAPTPPGKACTLIYGGPQTALVTGTLNGSRLWARFTRRDGCEIARWNRVAFLFQRS
jgi:hypothetical protein